MQKFQSFNGLVAPIDRPNVDTDAIIPKQFLKSIKRTGFGDYLFDEWRFLDKGEPGKKLNERQINTEFVLNKKKYEGAEILLCRENFGCGSSREHAPWALRDYGIKALVAPSFADIFFNNSWKNGLLLITLEEKLIDALFMSVFQCAEFKMSIDLVTQTINPSDGSSIRFNFDGEIKKRLLEGLDDIAITLKHSEAISDYEKKAMEKFPWLFN